MKRFILTVSVLSVILLFAACSNDSKEDIISDLEAHTAPAPSHSQGLNNGKGETQKDFDAAIHEAVVKIGREMKAIITEINETMPTEGTEPTDK